MYDISLTQLRAIVTLARRGTIAAAAAELGYTAGAVSQQLATLERSMGVPLLVRTGRRVELTDEGRTLVEHSSRILGEVLRAREAVTSAPREIAGRVDVGVFATSPARLFADALLLGRERHPHLDIHGHEVHPDAVAAAVAGFEVDLALGIEYPGIPLPRPDDVTVRTLVGEEFAIAVSREWAHGPVPDGPIPLAAGRGFPWALPTDDSHFASATRHAFRVAGFEPRVVHEITDTAATLMLVEEGVAATLATPLMASVRPGDGIRLIPLIDPPTRELVLIHRTGNVRATVAATAELMRSAWLGQRPGETTA